MIRFTHILILAALLLCQQAVAQRPQDRIDSMEQVAEAASEEDLPRILLDIAYECRITSPIRGIQNALRAMDVAEDNGDLYYIVESYNLLALNERYSKMENEALNHYKMALRKAQEFGLEDLYDKCYNNVARMCQELGDMDGSRPMIDSAFVYAKLTEDTLELSNAYLHLGLWMHRNGKEELALGYLKESFNMREMVLPPYDLERLIPLWHMADIYVEQKEYQKARDLINMNFQNSQLSQWHDFMSRLWYKLAQIYYMENMLDSAEYTLERAMQESVFCMDVQKMAITSKLMNRIYVAKGDFKKAADISHRFMETSDMIFNQELYDQFIKIQYTDEYQDNEKSISLQHTRRNTAIVLLLFALLAMVGSLIFYFVMVRSNKEISQLNKDLGRKQTTMQHRLKYAHAIQMAIQPDLKEFGEVFSDKFLLYIPRDIVSGDFFWKFSDDNHEMLVVADCTGHGVPGAMLTMLGTSILQTLASSGMRKAAEVLQELRARIIFLMGVNSVNKMQDGMDISLIVIDKATMKLDYAGAYNNLVYIRDGELHEIKATRCPIGEYIVEPPFKSQELQLQKDDCIYIMSDGYASQFGGDDNRKYSQRKLLKLLLEHHKEPMADFCKLLKKHFNDWRGNCEQVDDVTVAGFRV
ncbi:MAG: SpoIIE family protein phosphatase [Bacteroidales bacterium]|nr:SpoIIE family protein phosphatase [Bacteroidales bacterium]